MSGSTTIILPTGSDEHDRSAHIDTGVNQSPEVVLDGFPGLGEHGVLIGDDIERAYWLLTAARSHIQERKRKESAAGPTTTQATRGVQPERYVPAPTPPAPVKNSGIGRENVTPIGEARSLRSGGYTGGAHVHRGVVSRAESHARAHAVELPEATRAVLQRLFGGDVQLIAIPTPPPAG